MKGHLAVLIDETIWKSPRGTLQSRAREGVSTDVVVQCFY